MADADSEDATQTQSLLPLCRRVPLVTSRAPWQDVTLLSSRCTESQECWIPEWRIRYLISSSIRGGAARAMAPLVEIGTDVITSDTVQYSAGVVSGGASRVAAPWLELGRDALAATLWSGELFRRSAIGLELEGHFTRMVMLTKSLAKRLAEQPLVKAFEELVEDAELRRGNASYPLMLGLLLAAPHPASGFMLLCGQTVTMKAILVGSAATLGVGSYYLFNRFADEPNRIVQKRAALTCGVAGAAYLALVYAGGFPPEVAELFSFPELTLHYVAELIVNPLMLSNLGYLSGCSLPAMLPTLIFSELSTASFIGSTLSQWNPTQSSLLLCVGVGFMGLVGYSLNKLPDLADNVSVANRLRVIHASDFLMFSMTLFPMIHGLCIPEVIDPDNALKAFALLDAVTKLGMCHISLKSERVLKNAEQLFADAQAAQPARRR
mmetsp:Transcript_65006/g.107777  ORF Transcript_65006/g.107777 Transcript_65006/m.107777 type:complete len:437 (+) Transcript_65006:64-1374(+)